MSRKFIFSTLMMLLIAIQSNAQQAMSIDAGYIKNFHNGLNGVNLSSVLYLNKKWALALELNRFFPSVKQINNEETELSALDMDFNLHRYFPVTERLNFYPIVGVSHTSEKEMAIATKATHHINFFSANTGAGISFELSKKIHPAVEYTYAWGKINQQFFLINVAYEFEFKKKRKS